MIKYVFENNYEIELFDSKEEAIKKYDREYSRLTKAELKKLDYFRLYAIEAEDEEQIEDTADLMDLCAGIIKTAFEDLSKKNYNYHVADKETYTLIASFDTLNEAKKAFLDYEEADKKQGTYEEDFYCILDSDKNEIDVCKTEIQIWRELAGLSRPKMSKLMEIPVRTIENWEAGVTVPPAYVERLVIKELKEIASCNS